MRGTLYMRNRQGCLILNHFVKQEDEAILKKLQDKWLAVTFETMLYYFEVGKAWYEYDELHVMAHGQIMVFNMLIASDWPTQLAEYAATQQAKYDTVDDTEDE